MKVINKKKRSFLNILLSNAVFVYIGSILSIILMHLSPRRKKVSLKPVNLGKINTLESNPKFNKKNNSLIFSFNGIPSILVKVKKDKYKAFSAVCTHLGCIVGFKKDRNVFYCNCHGGTYNLNGKNIAGPPPKPLTSHQISTENGDLIIKALNVEDKDKEN